MFFLSLVNPRIIKMLRRESRDRVMTMNMRIERERKRFFFPTTRFGFPTNTVSIAVCSSSNKVWHLQLFPILCKLCTFTIYTMMLNEWGGYEYCCYSAATTLNVQLSNNFNSMRYWCPPHPSSLFHLIHSLSITIILFTLLFSLPQYRQSKLDYLCYRRYFNVSMFYK